MRVGREIDGKIALQVAGVPVQTQLQARGRSGGKIASSQVVDPQPRQCPESDFQGAGPVNAAPVPILLEPAIEKFLQMVQKLAPPGKLPGLCQRHQMLMPIQFPDNFVIPHPRRVQIREQPEVASAGLYIMDRIAPPADFLVHSEVQVDVVPQQTESALQDLLGRRHQLSRPVRPPKGLNYLIRWSKT